MSEMSDNDLQTNPEAVSPELAEKLLRIERELKAASAEALVRDKMAHGDPRYVLVWLDVDCGVVMGRRLYNRVVYDQERWLATFNAALSGGRTVEEAEAIADARHGAYREPGA